MLLHHLWCNGFHLWVVPTPRVSVGPVSTQQFLLASLHNFDEVAERLEPVAVDHTQEIEVANCEEHLRELCLV